MCAASGLADSCEYSSRIKRPSPCKQRLSVVHGVGRTLVLCLACSELHIQQAAFVLMHAVLIAYLH